MDLTDAQWAVLEPTFRPRRRPDRRGRPWTDARAVLNGVLWVLRTGAAWHDLPRRHPPYQTCHRRFQQWQRSGRLDRLLTRLAEDLRDRGKLDLTEAFVDATFANAKKGALPLALQRSARYDSARALREVAKHKRQPAGGSRSGSGRSIWSTTSVGTMT
jgi:transposase